MAGPPALWRFIAGPLPACFFAIEVAVLAASRVAHAYYFEGELGAVELWTFTLALLSVPIAIAIGMRLTGKWRAAAALCALGLFYFAGEEISWGQSWAKWETPTAWSELNHQRETNLHNLEGPLTLTNTAPRALLNLCAGATLVVFIPAVRRKVLASKLARRLRPEFWPTSFMLPTAALVVISDFMNQPLRPVTREWGETMELFMAWMLLVYFGGVLFKLSRGREAAPRTSP